MSWKPLTYTIRGVAPLLMHNSQLADPLNYYTKQIKRLSGKRNKTDADHEELARLEWYGSLYLQQGEPCITGEMLEGMLLRAARKQKAGQQAQAGLYCSEHFPLDYDGPRTPEALWADGRFRFTCSAKVRGQRIMRTRPRFDQWQLPFTVMYNDEMLNARDVEAFLQKGGEMVGLGDWVPKFGRFVVVEHEQHP